MIRDYVYVGDVVQANFTGSGKGEGEVFNIGTCIPTTTKDLYYAIAKQLGINREPLLRTSEREIYIVLCFPAKRQKRSWAGNLKQVLAKVFPKL